MRLDTLVEGTQDPELITYVLNNLGAGVPKNSRYYSEIAKRLTSYSMKIMVRTWSPNPTKLQLRRMQFQQIQAIKDQYEQWIKQKSQQHQFLEGLLKELTYQNDGVIQ